MAEPRPNRSEGVPGMRDSETKARRVAEPAELVSTGRMEHALLIHAINTLRSPSGPERLASCGVGGYALIL